MESERALKCFEQCGLQFTEDDWNFIAVEQGLSVMLTKGRTTDLLQEALVSFTSPIISDSRRQEVLAALAAAMGIWWSEPERLSAKLEQAIAERRPFLGTYGAATVALEIYGEETMVSVY